MYISWTVKENHTTIHTIHRPRRLRNKKDSRGAYRSPREEEIKYVLWMNWGEGSGGEGRGRGRVYRER